MYFQRHKLRFPQPGSKLPSEEEFMKSLGWHPPQWAGHEMFGWGRTPFDTALSRAANQPVRRETVIMDIPKEHYDRVEKAAEQNAKRKSTENLGLTVREASLDALDRPIRLFRTNHEDLKDETFGKSFATLEEAQQDPDVVSSFLSFSPKTKTGQEASFSYAFKELRSGGEAAVITPSWSFVSGRKFTTKPGYTPAIKDYREHPLTLEQIKTMKHAQFMYPPHMVPHGGQIVIPEISLQKSTEVDPEDEELQDEELEDEELQDDQLEDDHVKLPIRVPEEMPDKLKEDATFVLSEWNQKKVKMLQMDLYDIQETYPPPKDLDVLVRGLKESIRNEYLRSYDEQGADDIRKEKEIQLAKRGGAAPKATRGKAKGK